MQSKKSCARYATPSIIIKRPLLAAGGRVKFKVISSCSNENNSISKMHSNLSICGDLDLLVTVFCVVSLSHALVLWR
jgi:hypothetical protein